MPKQDRFSTKYPGVYYVVGEAVSREGKEKIYYIRYRRGGETIEEKAGHQFKDDMTPAKASRMRSRRIEGEPSNAERRREEEAKKRAEEARWTIQRLWEEYESTRVASPSLKTDKSRYQKYIKKKFGKKEPKEIFSLDIERIKRGLKGKSPQTVKHVLNLIDRIINHGVKKGLTEPLSFRIVKPRVDNLKTEDLTKDQLKKLLSAINIDSNHQARTIMLLILVTGLRRGETFRLQKSDLDFERGFIRLRNPKGGKSESIPMNHEAEKILSEYMRLHENPESDFVFPGRDGRQRVDIRRAVNRIKEKAGLLKDFRPLHGLRHYFASSLASSGEVDLHVLQKLLTHKDSRMTLRYAHLRDEALKKASNVAGQIIQSVGSEKKEGNGQVNQIT